MSSFEKNLSEGNVAKQLVLFSLPFLVDTAVPAPISKWRLMCSLI